MDKLLKVIYFISLVGFLSLGIILVLTQFLGVIIQNGYLAVQAEKILAKPAIMLSVICAFMSFFYRYTSKSNKK
ncbi:MAG: hypothetical protein Q4D95_01930 [Peptoniphilus sp.]|nr:hypothetical protein [Peptoniphilus sp.]